MVSDIDPKKIYQIQIKIRALEDELDSERDLRKDLEKEVDKLKMKVHFKGQKEQFANTMTNIPIPSMENKLPSDRNDVDFSQRVKQQD